MLTGFGFDAMYIVLVLPAIILSMYAQAKVKGTFNKYSNVANQEGYTGAKVAIELLERAGITDVRVEQVAGQLTDHYDPRDKVVRLSESVYSSPSLAAIGVAAHETGHAMQHATGYTFLGVRSAIVPIANFSSKISMPLIIIGFLLGTGQGSMGLLMAQIGVILFSAVVLFNLVTLPVEFNASSRAISALEGYGMLSSTEIGPAKKVLSAAALTYVAAAAVAIANLLRFVILLSGRSRD